MRTTLCVSRVDWEFNTPFRIAYRTRTHAETVRVELRSEDGLVGHGEALGVSYRGETAASICEQLRSLCLADITRETLQHLLPAGGARNALDCAFWDLECKRAGVRAWHLANMAAPPPVRTALTLALDTPSAMAAKAQAAIDFSLLKLKLDGSEDVSRVEQVRKARPDATIIVDANQSWTVAQLREFSAKFAALGVALIEQPLPASDDSALRQYRSPIPLCADEACQDRTSLDLLLDKYDYICIKLDKTGGLTEALLLAQEASDRGFRLMVGCMGGSSLSMAPAFVVAQVCDYADLDGPLLLTSDIDHSMEYVQGRLIAPSSALWG